MSRRMPFRSALTGMAFLLFACGCSRETSDRIDPVILEALIARERAQLAADRAALNAGRLEVEHMRDEARRLADETAIREAVLRYAEDLNDSTHDATSIAESVPDLFATGEKSSGMDPVAGASAEPFYSELEEDGSWFESDQYGNVWQPAIAHTDPDWAPFTNGGWVWTDYGWTWDDAETWGDLTAQYGRWGRMDGYGWIWVPGTDWAPAWVSWRENEDCIGWAPLPPDCLWRSSVGISRWVDSSCNLGPDLYCFLSRDDFTTPNCRRRLRAREHCATLFAGTRNVTRLVDAGSHCARSDGGPRRDRMTDPATIRVRKIGFVSRSDPGNADRETWNVLRVQPGPLTPDAGPPRTHGRIAEHRIDRGWGSVSSHADLRKLRKQALSDATDALSRLSLRSVATVPAPDPAKRSRIAAEPSPKPYPEGRAMAGMPAVHTLSGERRGEMPAGAAVSRAAPPVPATPASRGAASPTWEERRSAALIARRDAVERHRRELAERKIREAENPPIAASPTVSRTVSATPGVRSDRNHGSTGGNADRRAGPEADGRNDGPQVAVSEPVRRDAGSGRFNHAVSQARHENRPVPQQPAYGEQAEYARRQHVEAVARQRQADAQLAEQQRAEYAQRVARERQEAARYRQEQELLRRQQEQQEHARRQEEAARRHRDEQESRHRQQQAEAARRAQHQAEQQRQQELRRSREVRQSGAESRQRGGRR